MDANWSKCESLTRFRINYNQQLSDRKGVGIVVRELQPGLVEDYLQFFDRDGFADNSWWSGCYCGYYDDPCRDDEWDASGSHGPAHRAARSQRIRSGLARGFLAYLDGKVVGWCNAGPRSEYVNLRRYSVAVEDPAERVGSIMCFLVASPYRGRGVATALLKTACENFQRYGLSVAEAYPRTESFKAAEDELPWSASNYHGPLEMFLKAGFSVHRQLERFAIVRRSL